MVLKRIGLAFEGIAILIIAIKYISFTFAADHSTEALSKFIADILILGVTSSIPLEVTLIQVLGIGGIVLIVLDLIIFRGN